MKRSQRGRESSFESSLRTMLLIVSGPVALPDLRILRASITSLVCMFMLESFGLVLLIGILGRSLFVSSRSVCA